jgi:hypothetical protein
MKGKMVKIIQKVFLDLKQSVSIMKHFHIKEITEHTDKPVSSS